MEDVGDDRRPRPGSFPRRRKCRHLGLCSHAIPVRRQEQASWRRLLHLSCLLPDYKYREQALSVRSFPTSFIGNPASFLLGIAPITTALSQGETAGAMRSRGSRAVERGNRCRLTRGRGRDWPDAFRSKRFVMPRAERRGYAPRLLLPWHVRIRSNLS